MFYIEDIEMLKTYDLSKSKEYTHLMARLMNVDKVDLFDAQRLQYQLEKNGIHSQDVDFLPYDEIVKFAENNLK